jgi:hypothetical protein
MIPDEYEADLHRIRAKGEAKKEQIMPQQFQVNKYIRMVLSFLVGVLGEGYCSDREHGNNPEGHHLTWADIIAQLLTAAAMIVGIFIFALAWTGNGEMK